LVVRLREGEPACKVLSLEYVERPRDASRHTKGTGKKRLDHGCRAFDVAGESHESASCYVSLTRSCSGPDLPSSTPAEAISFTSTRMMSGTTDSRAVFISELACVYIRAVRSQRQQSFQHHALVLNSAGSSSREVACPSNVPC
jgi:hypothetical protein